MIKIKKYPKYKKSGIEYDRKYTKILEYYINSRML